ncbi:MAG: hypothetical protein IKP64_07275 [Selenomonadaceae bacterium]|nr:hypothetical protein [Selenomonadaceae bacterium]MBR4383342.1 hypothetical protein [Selenomonadaceae bacterium]
MGLFSDFFGNGGAPTQAWSPPSIPERFLNPSPVLEMQINDARRGILSDKRGWDDANRNINFLTKSLETPGLSDLQKQAINDNILKLNQTRDAFAASANERRANAQALGIDVSDYDSGKTLQEAAQAYSTYRNNAVKDFLNLPTVAQLEENRYLELRNRGASPAQADRILKRERAGREEEFLRRAEEGIMTYGTNPDGSLNPIGVELVRRMNPSDPQIAAALYANAFAMPKNIFTEDRADNRTALNNQSTLERQQAALAAAAIQQANQLKFAEWQTNTNNEAQDARLDKTLASHERIAQINARLKNVTGLPEDKLAAEIDSVARVIGDRQKAAELVLRQKYFKSFDDLKENAKSLEDREKFATFADGRFGDIEYFLKTDNRATAKDLIGRFREFILGDDFKYAEQADADSKKFLLEQLDEYEQVADGKMTLAQLNAKRERYPESPAGLSKANHNEPLNEEAEKISTEAARKERNRRNMVGESPINPYLTVEGRDGKKYYVTELGLVEQ